MHTDSVEEYCAISSDDEGVEDEVVRVEGSSVKGLLKTLSSSSAKLKTPAVWGHRRQIPSSCFAATTVIFPNIIY